MTSMDGSSTLTVGTRLVDGETLAGWGATARSPHRRLDVMLGLWSSLPRLILHSQVPELTPTTPLKCRL